MKPHLIVVINSLSSGGAERVVSHILWNLRNKFDIHLVLLNKKIDFPIPDGITVVDFKQPESENSFAIIAKLPLLSYKLYKYCKTLNNPVSISFLNRANYINSFMKGLYSYKGKIIVSERTHISSLLRLMGKVYSRVTRKLIQSAYNSADIVLANSYAMEIDLKENFQVGERSRVIRNPVNVTEIKAQAAIPVEFMFDKDVFYFISVGGFRKEKNQELLIEAIHKIRHLPVHLLLVGDGPLRSKLEYRVAEFGLSNMISFLGFDKNPYKYIIKSDCFVLPSLLEGFPNVLLEALACNLPVISADCKSGPREILAPGTDLNLMATDIEYSQFGILVPSNNAGKMAEAMEAIYADKLLQKKYAAAGEACLPEYSISTVMHAFEQLLSSET